MKARLLSLACPLPASAILAADFEVFRESVYTVRAVEDVAEPEPFLPAPAGNNMCSWCGIWQSLPSPRSTGELSIQPTVATNVAVAAESDPGELPQPSRLKRYSFKRTRICEVPSNVFSESYEAENRPTIEDLLQSTLCNAVSEIRYSRRELPVDRQLRKQRAAALRARWVGRALTGLAWLDE